MQTRLAPEFLKARTAGEAAEAILRRCVHCGFCTATCPTYQLLGDELDGPRGRIYLIKQVLEGAETPTRARRRRTWTAASPAATARSTCPSGVQYGQLLEIGREIVDRQSRAPGPPPSAAVHWLLKRGPDLAASSLRPAMKLGQWPCRPLVPARPEARSCRPKAGPRAHQWPTRSAQAQDADAAGLCTAPR